jgi:lysozyme family protein
MTDQQGFEIWYRFMTESEGGYVNDPRDRGGETNKGVIWRNFASPQWRKHLGTDKLSDKELRELFLKMPDEIHRRIAKELHWDKIDMPIIPIKIILVEWMWGSGPSKIRYWQYFLNQTLGKNIPVDGIYGPITRDATIEYVNKYGIVKAIKDLNAVRRYHLEQALAQNQIHWAFANGLRRRINRLEDLLLFILNKGNVTDEDIKKKQRN